MTVVRRGGWGSQITTRRAGQILALTGLAGGTCGLVWAGPRPSDLPHTRAGLASWLTRTPIDESIATVAGLAAEMCLVWLCLGALLVCLGRLPGLTGRLSRAVATRVTPHVLRRAVETALGLTVATASISTTAAPALADSPGSRSVATASPAPELPSLDRPASRPAAPSSRPPTPRPALVPIRPVQDQVVVVRRGDSLWAIAARHLGPSATDAETAAAWPRWYAANRAVIGPDPDLLLPGQRLRAPDYSPTTAQGSPR